MESMESVEEGDITTLVGFGILLCIFTVGMFLQIKIIKGLKQDRTTAWEIDLSHSVVMMVHFSFVILFEIAIYTIPTLDAHHGNWVCSASFYLRMLGAGEIFFHSLIISFYKYLFIVHHFMVINIGPDRMKKILRCVYLLLLIGGSLSYTFRPNFRAFNSVHNCGTQQSETDVDLPNRLFMCGTVDLKYNTIYDYVMNIATAMFCSVQTILAMLIYLNILEIFFYIGIFRHMKR